MVSPRHRAGGGGSSQTHGRWGGGGLRPRQPGPQGVSQTQLDTEMVSEDAAAISVVQMDCARPFIQRGLLVAM